MEVILISLVILLILVVIRVFSSNSKLISEVEYLNSALRKEMTDNDRTLEDQRNSERELAIYKAKFESLQKSALTPDNSIPKDLHLEKVFELSSKLTDTESKLQETTEKFEKSRGTQISERVRLGQTAENFAGFFTEFPYDRKNVKALFQPIDLIYFGDDEVVFIDVKTGASTLSTKQRKIRDNINSGKVRFEVHRLDENGYKISDK